MSLKLLLALCGCAFVTVGFCLWSVAAGFVVAGVLMVASAYVWQTIAAVVEERTE